LRFMMLDSTGSLACLSASMVSIAEREHYEKLRFPPFSGHSVEMERSPSKQLGMRRRALEAVEAEERSLNNRSFSFRSVHCILLHGSAVAQASTAISLSGLNPCVALRPRALAQPWHRGV
jgi:hypothetical protein